MTMLLQYPDKVPAGEVLATKPSYCLAPAFSPEDNLVIEGDNLQALRCLLHTHGLGGKVDLIYIDPPYATNTVFRVGKERTAHVSSSSDGEVAYKDTLTGWAFIEFLRQRLILLHALLAPSGSIMLHIDCKIGHYVKVVMDEVFGIENFRNDITRIKCNPKNFARKGFGNVKDVIFFYSKGEDFVWHEPREARTDADIARLFSKVDGNNRRYTTTPLHAPGQTANGPTGQPWRGIMPPAGRHWRYAPAVLDSLDKQGLIEWSSTNNPRKIIYAQDAEASGKKIQDIWEFKDHPYPQYPTEKNLDLLKMIVGACSDPGGLVLDCFCGSGTTLLAAQELDRRCIGIDSSPSAIRTTLDRLIPAQASFGAAKRAVAHLRLKSEVPGVSVAGLARGSAAGRA
jgi:adenine-specific DNA-methyltransferase